MPVHTLPAYLRIVAIGGGETGRDGLPVETTAIDREIIRLTGKKKPLALFFPTASTMPEVSWNTFRKHYGGRLGCRTDVAWLSAKTPPAGIRAKIMAADIIYVGGGNTLKMLKLWRRLGVHRMLAEAGRRGKVLSGLSAGGICWFARGNSDSPRFSAGTKALMRVSGLGLLPGLTFCPHYDVEKHRRPSLRRMAARYGGRAVAADNCAALEFAGGQWRVLASKKHAAVRLLGRCRGRVTETVLPCDGAYRPYAELFA